MSLNFFAASASALPINSFATQTTAQSCEKSFLGLEGWYYYLPDSDFGKKDSSGSLVSGTKCDVTAFNIRGGDSDIPAVLLAVVDDLLRIAGLVAFAFIIVGGVKFITSEGNSDKATEARNTLINALIGIAISITAIVLVNFIGTSIGNHS